MLQIHTIPALVDNYIWLIQPDMLSPSVYVVDPGTDQPLINYLEQHDLTLKAILLTHHHHDHIGGVNALQNRFNLPVYGPHSKRIPQVTHYLYENDQLQLDNLMAKIITLPGHTLDHIAYFIEASEGSPLLFSGDTLFAVGCGRLFDGSATLLYSALQKIASLADNTLIYASHEYTLSNIRFALTIEPENTELQLRQIIETNKRKHNIATLPSQLGAEKRTNPFLRCHLNSIHAAVERLSGKALTTDLDVFTHLRHLKDCF